MSVRSLALALCAALVLGGLAASGLRVRQLERNELEHQTPSRTLAQLASAPGSTRVSARLAQVALRRGEDALFELCSADRLEPTRWLSAFDLAVFHLPDMRLMLRVRLDRAHLEGVRRGEQGACLSLGGGRIEVAGDYSVDAVWPERPPSKALQQVPLYARVLARAALTTRDRNAVIAIGFGILLALAIAMTSARRGAAAEDPSAVEPAAPSRTENVRALAAALAALVLLAFAAEVPSPDVLWTFGKGLMLALLQAGAAWLLARTLMHGTARDALGLAPPPSRARWSVAALFAAVVLMLGAKLALRYVPTTGEAPIQTFVSWPSGMLCFAALGVLLPLGEELFFRGYVYRAALAWGRSAAYAAALIPFVALHAQQSWGNWGALASIAFAGVVLTGLRARSGSALVSAIAHVLYNFALSMASF